MECLSNLLDRKAALEPGWGGPGEIKPMLDDGVEPGPGEEGADRLADEWYIRRLLMLEETVVKRGRDGHNRDGRGSGVRKGMGGGAGAGRDHKGWRRGGNVCEENFIA